MDLHAEAIANLRSTGWVFEPGSPRSRAAPGPLRSAAPNLVAWASSFSRLSSPDEAVWFLSVDDFEGASTDAFAWNEFEALSRDSALSIEDEALVAEFWCRHCPILISVRDRYAYLAVRTDGAIVYGEEPEFEQASVVADDLTAFLESVANRAGWVGGRVEAVLFGAA